MQELTIGNLYGGGVEERIKSELDRVIENIIDVNTTAKKTRKIKLELTIKPNEQRNMAEMMITTSSTLCPAKPLETSVHFGKDLKTGVIEISEFEQFTQCSLLEEKATTLKFIANSNK